MNASCHAFPKWRIFKALLATSWALGHCHLNRNYHRETSILTELRNHWRWSRQLVGPSQHKRDDQLLNKSTSAPFPQVSRLLILLMVVPLSKLSYFHKIPIDIIEGGVCSQGIVRQSKIQRFLRLEQRCLHRMLIHRITTQRSVCCTVYSAKAWKQNSSGIHVASDDVKADLYLLPKSIWRQCYGWNSLQVS